MEIQTPVSHEKNINGNLLFSLNYSNPSSSNSLIVVFLCKCLLNSHNNHTVLCPLSRKLNPKIYLTPNLTLTFLIQTKTGGLQPQSGSCSSKGYSAEAAPLDPELKLSINRTVLLSIGTVVPPDCEKKET